VSFGTIEIDANRNALHGLEMIADWIRCPETEYRTGATTQVRHMSFPRSAIGIQFDFDWLARPQLGKLRLLEIGSYPDVIE
jgi:hypothetical protein